MDIIVNQIGFMPLQKKTVFFCGKTGDVFYVKNISNDSVFAFEINKTSEKQYNGEEVSFGDFTKVNITGEYYIECDNIRSEEFVISNDVYRDLFLQSNKMLYLQRCGCVLPKDVAQEYAHGVCHNTLALLDGTINTFIDVSGGWHDAGDYGRYVVPGAKTVADLLLAYNSRPDIFSNNLLFGETKIDVLSEARYELEWFFKMQSVDGSVYHKVTCRAFPGFVPPEKETEQLVVSQISTPATADFCAVMAMAYKTYLGVDGDFAKKCFDASLKAYSFLEKNECIDFVNPPHIITGEYGDKFDKDERFWANCALFDVTNDKKYKNAIDKLLQEELKYGLGWDDVATYGLVIYLNSPFADKTSATYKKMQEKLIEQAYIFVKNAQTDAYHISLNDDFPWGSNMIVLNNAMTLFFAYDLTKNKEYFDTAVEHLYYILGANPLKKCYVTGFGANPAKNPHHRPSISVGKAVKGMLVGGPAMGLFDECAKHFLSGKPPMMCYIDDKESFSTNEICIYWNSPLIYVLSRIV